MDILLYEESINILADHTHPIRFANILDEVSKHVGIEPQYIKNKLWNVLINSPLILTSNLVYTNEPTDDALHLLCNKLRFRRHNLELYESVIKNTQRIRVLLAIARRKYEGYWQSELSTNLSIDPKNLFQLLQILCKQKLVVKLNMPFYAKGGIEYNMCFSTSSASSNSILFHIKYFVFDKFPDYIKTQLGSILPDFFGDSLLNYVSSSPNGILLESDALNYYTNLASASAVKLCVSITAKVVEKGFYSLLNYLIQQSKITRALAYCSDTGKNEIVLLPPNSKFLREDPTKSKKGLSMDLYQLNSRLTLSELICKAIIVSGSKGLVATEISQILSIRLKPLTKFLNALCPNILKKVPERDGKLFYYRYSIAPKFLNMYAVRTRTEPAPMPLELPSNGDDKTHFLLWLRDNIDKFSLNIGIVNGKMNTVQFRSRISVIIEYIKKYKFISVTDIAKIFCIVGVSEKLVDKKTVNRLVSHVLRQYSHINQIKFYSSQNSQFPINIIYDNRTIAPETIKEDWNMQAKTSHDSNNKLSSMVSDFIQPPADKNNDLPVISATVSYRIMDASEQNVSFSQKVLFDNGYLNSLVARLKTLHEFLITLDSDLKTEKEIINSMPLSIFLKTIGCGYPIGDWQWICNHSLIHIQNLPKDKYKILMHGAIGRVSNVKSRRIATQVMAKLCTLLNGLGLIASITEPANNDAVYQYWQVNHTINKPFCNKSLLCGYCTKVDIPMQSKEDLERFWSHLKIFVINLNDNITQLDNQIQIPKDVLLKKNWKGLLEENIIKPTDKLDVVDVDKFLLKYIHDSQTSDKYKHNIDTRLWWIKLECAKNLISPNLKEITDLTIYKLVSLLWGFDSPEAPNPTISWNKCKHILYNVMRESKPFKTTLPLPVKNLDSKYILRSLLITPLTIDKTVLFDCFSLFNLKEMRQMIRYWTSTKFIHKESIQNNLIPGIDERSPFNILLRYRIAKRGNLRLFGSIGAVCELQQLWYSQKANSHDNIISILEKLYSENGRLVIENKKEVKDEKLPFSGGLESHYTKIQQPSPKPRFIPVGCVETAIKLPSYNKAIRGSDPIFGLNLELEKLYETDEYNSFDAHLKSFLSDIDLIRLKGLCEDLKKAGEKGLAPSRDSSKELQLLCLLKLAFRIPGKSWRYVAGEHTGNLLITHHKTNYVKPEFVQNDMWLKHGMYIKNEDITRLTNEFGLEGTPLFEKISPTIFTNIKGEPNFPIFALVPLRVYYIVRNSPGLTLSEIADRICFLELSELDEFISSMIDEGLLNKYVNVQDSNSVICYFCNIKPNFTPYEKIFNVVISNYNC